MNFFVGHRFSVTFSGIILAALLFLAPQAGAQTAEQQRKKSCIEQAMQLMTKQSLRQTVNRLADPQLRGRESSEEEIFLARRVVTDAFITCGVKMYGQAYMYGFHYWVKDSKVLGVNVIGYIPADSSASGAKTVVIGAHYDHLGVLGGRIYPGADNNASGVAVLLELGKALAYLRSEGIYPKCNICLVAFDAKEADLAGSRMFLSQAVVRPQDISLMINLDQIGTTLAPPERAKTDGLLPKNYLLFLGMQDIPEDTRAAFTEAETAEEPIVLDFTYYGNSQINNLLFKMGDQYPFSQAGIPAFAITSGLHKYTNKTTDTPDIINFNAMTERCRLILRALLHIAQITTD